MCRAALDRLHSLEAGADRRQRRAQGICGGGGGQRVAYIVLAEQVELDTRLAGRAAQSEGRAAAGITGQVMGGEVGIGAVLHVPAGRDVTVALAPGRTADDVLRRMSLVEFRGGAPAKHPKVEIESLEGAIVIIEPTRVRVLSPPPAP